MLTEQHREDLRVKGYTVVHKALSDTDADNYKKTFSDWAASFKGDWPHSHKSLIQRYKVGHLEPCWAIRLKVKDVFRELWGTEQLLTSFDAIAIGRPPEDGEEDFYSEGQHWLHLDQAQERQGLHAYQGAVYLEDCDEDDWAFEVIEGSHEYHNRYYEENDYAIEKRKENPTWRFKHLRPEDVEFFTKHWGLKRCRVAVPKGGMILWDSRLVHANNRPLQGRKHPGRWRYAVFVCMTPAKWAGEVDLAFKRKAYENLNMTVHWPSDGVGLMADTLPPYAPKDPNPMTSLPPSALTDEAKRLAGVLPYDQSSDDGGPKPPKWLERKITDCQGRREFFDSGYDEAFLRRRRRTLSVFAVLVAMVVYYCFF